LAFKPVPDSPIEQLVAEYRTWLVVDRGLAAATVLRYENLARRFLGQQPAAEDGQVAVDLTAADVVGFLLRESERVSVGAVKGRVAELRSLLRFLHLKGFTPTALASAVPPAAGWHDTGIPVGLSATEVQRLLDGCDQTSPTGIRNFAILMLVARLGLRSIEVARLELGDIDWRAGEIQVAGKARRRDRLPLPHDVGQALWPGRARTFRGHPGQLAAVPRRTPQPRPVPPRPPANPSHHPPPPTRSTGGGPERREGVRCGCALRRPLPARARHPPGPGRPAAPAAPGPPRPPGGADRHRPAGATQRRPASWSAGTRP
jgi:integrase